MPDNRSLYPPAGAIVAKVLPDGEKEIFYPFFSTHFMLPLKVGEVVWVSHPDSPLQTELATPSTLIGGSSDSQMIQGNPNNVKSDIDAIRTQPPGGGPFKRALVVEFITRSTLPGYDTDTGEFTQLSNDEEAAQHRGGFWFSRVVGSRLSEDLNFTHIDRDLDQRIHWHQTGVELADVLGDDEGLYAPSFPNGRTLPVSADSTVTNVDLTSRDNSRTYRGRDDDYLTHIRNAIGNSFHPEPTVPPSKGMAGDFVLNGSNNTSIVLGSDPPVHHMGASSEWPSGTPNASEDARGRHGSAGKISLVVGKGFQDAKPSVVSSDNGEFIEQEKAAELRASLIEDPELFSTWENSFSSAGGNASINLYAYKRTAPEYIQGADGQGTFTSTAPNAGEKIDPTIPYSFPEFYEDPTPEPFTEGLQDGSYVTVTADHVRIGGNRTLRIGVSGLTAPGDEDGSTGAEIILHKDGNIFLKPGTNGRVYIGGGPDELDGEQGAQLDDEGFPTFCDMLCFPDAGEPISTSDLFVEKPVGAIGEMGNYAKYADYAPNRGRRFSPKVKVKT